jgi:hypothetical protein
VIVLAELTKQKIEEVQEADQGASFRQFLQKVLPHMGDAYAGKSDNPFRKHLGASIIGKSCERQIWYSFRWYKRGAFSGRMLRLFNRGHLEEARVIASLLSIGVQIFQQDENGKQFRITDAGGHFGGSGDGVAIGIPDIPIGAPCLLEMKTHSSKYFGPLVKNGVRVEKPEHYVQMQMYLGKMGIRYALYAAVNKDTDEYHLEVIEFDSITYEMYLNKAVALVFMRDPPRKINNSPAWFECKFCDYARICHFNVEPERNCRTCHYSVPEQNGTWSCYEPSKPKADLKESEQLAGCVNHLRK